MDDSSPAEFALEEALQMLGSEEIIVLTVIDTKDFTHGPEGGATQALYDTKKENAIKLFESAQERAAEHGIQLTHAIETGDPGKEIVHYAKEHDIDHIVMGSHGRSGISRLLLGSVAEHLVRNAPASVMVSRQHKRD